MGKTKIKPNKLIIDNLFILIILINDISSIYLKYFILLYLQIEQRQILSAQLGVGYINELFISGRGPVNLELRREGWVLGPQRVDINGHMGYLFTCSCNIQSSIILTS